MGRARNCVAGILFVWEGFFTGSLEHTYIKERSEKRSDGFGKVLRCQLFDGILRLVLLKRRMKLQQGPYNRLFQPVSRFLTSIHKAVNTF